MMSYGIKLDNDKMLYKIFLNPFKNHLRVNKVAPNYRHKPKDGEE